MARPALFFVFFWTLALILLGSVVHATDSSLACPDWPTCFGTLMPEMTGGVFWEHLHRLWAGALVILFTVTVILLRRAYPERDGLYRLGLAGIGLLVFQSVLGGITVLYELPDAVSTIHLALAFIFLGVLMVMIAETAPAGSEARPSRRSREHPEGEDPESSGLVKRAGIRTGVLVFAQSVVGALVRHTDAGVACPDIPLCLGRLIPPLDHPLVRLHFLHRVLGFVVAAVALRYAWLICRRVRQPLLRRLAVGLGIGVAAQVALGFASVAFQLRPLYVSAHTLLAATLFALATALATYAREDANP